MPSSGVITLAPASRGRKSKDYYFYDCFIFSNNAGGRRMATAKEYPVESKVFHWSLGCNPWGRYLRISENGAG